jgi:PAS domain S-box-containing protein
MDDAPVGFVLLDTECRYLLVNRHLADLNGLAPEKHVGRTIEEVVPSVAKQVREVFQEVAETRRPVLDREFKGTTPKAPGQIRYWSESWYPVHGSDGAWLGVAAIIFEITERKHAQHALQRSEAYLAESQRLSRIGSWVWDLATARVVFWSPELYRIYGLDPQQASVAVPDVLSRVHPEDRSIVENLIARMSSEKSDFDVEFRALLPDGTLKYLRSIGHPMLDHASDLVEFTGVLMDVSERKRAEQELQRSFRHVRTLSARLQSVGEEERKRVAREIHDELGQALTAIKIDVSALAPDLPVRHERRVESILNLIDQTIKAVRRISTELRPGILDDLGLVAAVEWAAEEFQERTGIVCSLEVQPDSSAIDPECATALFRIFQETLTNVARHAKATRVDVRLAEENGDITLDVRDNGSGASEKQLLSGKSLGIAGMRERALLLGGAFEASGAPGKGTTVRVRIPWMSKDLGGD